MSAYGELLAEHAMTMHWNAQTIRELERKSIRDFVSANRQYLTGRVLDFGAGKPGTCREPQPYRDLVNGQYNPYDKGDPYPLGKFNAILCTQVLQSITKPEHLISAFYDFLVPGGYLVMTYASCWDEVEDCDLWRFTKSGMDMMLRVFHDFTIVSHERRAEIELGGFKFPLGHGVVAQR